jgi:hypothetical protein
MSDSKELHSGVKRCFVIAPIGEDGSEVRRRSDKVLRHVIEPAARACGYSQVLRSDKVDDPGLIGTQIVTHLLEDELVIADLSGHNPNVFYELALRHAVQKPVVQLIEDGERIPFDVGQMRTLKLDHRDLVSAADCPEALVRSIQAVEQDPTLVDSPLSQAITIRALSDSPKSEDRLEAEMFNMMMVMNRRIEDLSLRLSPKADREYVAPEPTISSEARRDYVRSLATRLAMVSSHRLTENEIKDIIDTTEHLTAPGTPDHIFRDRAARIVENLIDASSRALKSEPTKD